MTERRRWRRRPAGGVRGWLFFGSEESGEPVEVLNLSPGGVRLAVGCRINPGTVVEVQLDRPGRGVSSRVRVRVVCLFDRLGDRFILGGAFTRPLDADLVRGLL